MNDNDRMNYALGFRDAFASVLAETKDKIKLPEQAKFYAEKFEKHFSHDWHTSN